MARTGIHGYTAETGKYTIKDGIITAKKEPTERSSNDYITTPSGRVVPTYGHAVVQRGADGRMYTTNNDGETTALNGGSYTYKSGAGAPTVGSSSGENKDDRSYSPYYRRGLGAVGLSSYRGNAGGGGASYGGANDGSPAEQYGLADPGTQSLQDRLTELEANKPAAYVNQYEGQIKNILDGILNRKAFDINTDPNYGKLYDLYSQHYTQNANRAARDAMGQLAGMTGGYGSTYAQTVGSQAYDNIIQGLNDNDINLMNLAYGIYQDDRNFDLNKMNTLRGLEGDDYEKYRDIVGDYYNDLNHFTNRYNTAWGNDYQLNRDSISDARYEDELAYAREQDAINRALAEEERDYERAWNEDDRAYSRNNSAFQNALSLAKAGYDPSGYLTDNGYNGSNADLLRGIAAQVQAANAVTGGSGGGSGSRGRGKSTGSGTEEKVSTATITNRNGNGWVYVNGLGRVTDKELQNAVNSGKVKESYNSKTNAYTYTKK